LRHDGGFRSVEHIVGKSLGNQARLVGAAERVLTPGVVCDRCNNGRLAELDAELARFPPIELMRAWHGVPTREGVLPVHRAGNLTLTASSRTERILYAHNKKAFEHIGPNSFRSRVRTGGPIPARRYARVAAALQKIALEFIHHDHVAAALAFDPKFDELRQVVLGHRRSPGWLNIFKNCTPHGRISITYWWEPIDGDGGTVIVLADIFGVVLATDLLRRKTVADPNEAPPDWHVPESNFITWTDE